MKISKNGRALIERYEGLILQSYDDANDHIVPTGGSSRGTLTIGYGHTSAAGLPKVFAGQVITQQQADTILASDLGRVEADVNRLVKVPISQNQFDALGSFHFNTGSLGKSSLLTSLNKKDYKGAADKFMAYVSGRVNGQLVPMAGLTRRRTEERKLFLTPDRSTVVAPTVGTATVGAGIGLSQYLHSHQTAIIVGAVILAVIIGTVIHIYRNKGNING